MTDQVKVFMAQINTIVGDITGNVQAIKIALDDAKERGADIVVFPEMTLTGYPPEDLLLRPALYPQIETALQEIANYSKEVACVVGYPMMDDLGDRYNMAAWIYDGFIQASYIKQNLPNYSVFDEQRYFSAGNQPCVVNFKGIDFGLLICEDIWKVTPAIQSREAGAEVIITLNSSPFSSEKHQDRLDTLTRRVSEINCPVIYVNQVGAQDELVFDGGSFAISAEGEVCVQAPEFKESLTEVTLLKQADSLVVLPGQKAPLFENEARIYHALKTGIHDYIIKNGFERVLLGLSGGIDSALTLALAVDALGADKVRAVMMPFKYTAEISKQDADAQAKAMGVCYEEISIEPIYDQMISSLENTLQGTQVDTTEENLQARIRGTLLMAISNKTGALVLATSNKSEAAVGYSTLYGDMVGGLSPLKDVPKTLVYRLANYRNTVSQVIPERVITRAPSAELRPDQTDQDSLPDYSVLDTIVEEYINHDQSPQAIIKKYGYEEAEVKRVVRLIRINEYKRRQAPLGIKITPRAFGRDRRYPITHKYIE